ncbi:unnamed protein product [Didymodactylos carnosus]|uniref:Endonuclease/exonuclease/phosphatase domain-containing protein n=1 Tax=Didymodactylos carnosus TaxID=1234261 RepID=A0A814R4Z5_9BILA|nr:unnamed protein product [Didymodactylos carnosus]CAF1127145.1 unnamed protein product [Didymodactylos carnosus]CAF3579564.1 unnamed protein product [Didymodactylos carnosus]CAF3890763.1 unnamed protein product [Didymodactylos carnosus]
MNDFRENSYRLGRRPVKQGPRPLLIGTWNVQTLWAAGKLELLRNEMKRFRYDVIGISEVRWTGKGKTPHADFIWSGEETVHMRGVGFLLSAQAKKALIGYNPISSRIISVRLSTEVITKTDKKDIIILTGDWNAKIGSENADWKSVMEYAQQYKDSCRRVKKSARQDKEHWINDQCEQAEKGLNIGNTREAYSLLKTLRSEFVPRLNGIRDQRGTMLQAKDDIKQRWTQYCSSLYKDSGGRDAMVKELEDITPPGNEESQDILNSEVQTAIRALKRNKSPGSDGITAEMLQAGGEQLARQIHNLCNKA